jgi:1-deoxy-D-xylulose-5-phosphate synthase
VTFAIDRAGMVGSDGATHQGSFDLSFMRCIPNMVIMAPADEDECRQMLYTATTVKGPAAVRYPRGPGPGKPLVQQMTALPIGRGEIRRHGRSGLALIAVGSMVAPALQIADRLDATLVNLRFIKPLDEDLVLDIAARHSAVVTIEENVVAGGAGSAIGELLASQDVTISLMHIGIPDKFIEHGSREDCLALAGLDDASLSTTIERWWASHSASRARSVGRL